MILKQFVQQVAELAAMLPTQIIGIKNLNSVYIYCSANFAELLGYSVSEIIGQHGMFVNDENSSARIHEDQQIIITGKAQAFVHIDRVKGKLSPLTFIKSPIINQETGQPIGILCQVFEFAAFDISQQILRMYKDMNLDEQPNQQLPHLSKREKQVIFLFLASLNSAEMVEVIYRMEGKRISKGTIDCVFTDQLFPKFEVYNRQALYAKLTQLGYNRMIPLEMITSETIALDTHDIY